MRDLLIKKNKYFFSTEEPEYIEDNQRRDQIGFYNDHEALNEDTNSFVRQKYHPWR